MPRVAALRGRGGRQMLTGRRGGGWSAPTVRRSAGAGALGAPHEPLPTTRRPRCCVGGECEAPSAPVPALRRPNRGLRPARASSTHARRRTRESVRHRLLDESARCKPVRAMYVGYTAEQEALRQELRAYYAKLLTPAVREAV